MINDVNSRISAMDRYASGMMDMQLPRNPIAEEVVVIFNDLVRDVYQDAHTREVCRVKKPAMVAYGQGPNPFVQFPGGADQVVDMDGIPWTVTLTMTDLPRVPKTDDQISIEGIVYTISQVSPTNREITSILNLKIYPERGALREELEVTGWHFPSPSLIEIFYHGAPAYYSFNPDSIDHTNLREPYPKFIPLDWPEPYNTVRTLYVWEKDQDSEPVKIEIDYRKKKWDLLEDIDLTSPEY